MSHKIREYDTAIRPAWSAASWHDLEDVFPGEILKAEDIPNVACPVYLEDFPVPDGYFVGRNGISKAIVAESAGRKVYVNVVSPQYKVFPNDRIFNLIVESLEKNGIPARCSFALTMDNLAKVSYAFELTSPGEFFDGVNNEHKIYINFINYHDGSGGCRGFGSTTRPVCDNTCQLALKGAKKGFDYLFYHDRIGEQMLNEVPALIEASLANAEQYADLRKQMMNAPIKFGKARAIAAQILCRLNKGKGSSQIANASLEIANLFERGLGNDGATVRDLFDGATQYFTSGDGSGSEKVNPFKKMVSSDFGTAAQKKIDFLQTLQRNSGDLISDSELSDLEAAGNALLKEFA